MSFDFINYNSGANPYNLGAPMPAQAYPTGSFQPQVPQIPTSNVNKINITSENVSQRPIVELPKITGGNGSLFKPIDAPGADRKRMNIPIPNSINEDDGVVKSSKKKRESTDLVPANNSDLVTGKETEKTIGTVENYPTAYTYMETTGILKQTLGQIDSLNGELMQEFNSVRTSRTMKNKYNVLVGLSENIGSLISNKISAIKEINNSISKSNELDYKRIKDNKAAQAAIDDDKYIADLYKSFINNPQAQIPSLQLSPIDMSTYSGGIIRADINNQGAYVGSGTVYDTGYHQYMANLTPEENLMRYESNPNVKQAVVYDPVTGTRYFQYYDMSSMTPIPNMPTYDNLIMEDTIIDTAHGIAKNNNLHEQFPLVIIGNDNIVSQY